MGSSLTARSEAAWRVARSRSMPAVKVSDSHRFLFVHVQKTGGNTVERHLAEHVTDLRPVKGLGGAGPRHAPLRRMLRIEPQLADYYVFGFVRDPWERMVSWWSMIQDMQRRVNEADARAIELMSAVHWWRHILATYPDFSSFVLEGLDRERRMNRPQVSYLRTRKRSADFIGRTENFDADLARVMSTLGLPEPASTYRENTSPHHADHLRYYDDATWAKVATVFAADVEAFGYAAAAR